MHRVLKKARGMNKKELGDLILKRYSKVRGDYGKNTFKEKVLPIAYKIYKEPSLLVIEMFRVIQIAKRYKINKLEDYLSEVVQNLNK